MFLVLVLHRVVSGAATPQPDPGGHLGRHLALAVAAAAAPYAAGLAPHPAAPRVAPLGATAHGAVAAVTVVVVEEDFAIHLTENLILNTISTTNST